MVSGAPICTLEQHAALLMLTASRAEQDRWRNKNFVKNATLTRAIAILLVALLFAGVGFSAIGVISG